MIVYSPYMSLYYWRVLKNYVNNPFDVFSQDPAKCRFSQKYNHSAGCLEIKMTDNASCLRFKTDAAQVLASAPPSPDAAA